jgi:hypothetical protein
MVCKQTSVSMRWPHANETPGTIAAVRELRGFASFEDKRGGMETIGIEPMTPCLQSRCSPS